jgi:hypothetical protein
MSPYQSPAALRTALEARLQKEARERGMNLDRLRRRAVFERLLIRLEIADPGIWVLKGGTALEVRWRERARTTKDLDLALREPPPNGEALHELLLARLSHDPDGDGFRFDIAPPRDAQHGDSPPGRCSPAVNLPRSRWTWWPEPRSSTPRSG